MDGTLVELALSRALVEEQKQKGYRPSTWRSFAMNVPGGVVLYTVRSREPGAPVPGTFVPGCRVSRDGLIERIPEGE